MIDTIIHNNNKAVIKWNFDCFTNTHEMKEDNAQPSPPACLTGLAHVCLNTNSQFPSWRRGIQERPIALLSQQHHREFNVLIFLEKGGYIVFIPRNRLDSRHRAIWSVWANVTPYCFSGEQRCASIRGSHAVTCEHFTLNA